jgi:hypothetical protein
MWGFHHATIVTIMLQSDPKPCCDFMELTNLQLAETNACISDYEIQKMIFDIVIFLIDQRNVNLYPISRNFYR